MKNNKVSEIFSAELWAKAHEVNVKNGWWDPMPNPAVLFSKIIEEVGEAISAMASPKKAKNLPFSSTQSPYYSDRYRELIKGTLEEEIADIAIRCMDFSVGFGYEMPEPEKKVYSLHGNVDNSIIFMLMGISEFASSLTNKLFVHGDNVHPLLVRGAIAYTLGCCIKIANEKGFDLLHQIELKIAYNATREFRHGNKKF